MSRIILSYVFLICLSGSRSLHFDTSPNPVHTLANLVNTLQNQPQNVQEQNPAYNSHTIIIHAPPSPPAPMSHFTSSFQTPTSSVHHPVVTDVFKLLGLLPSHSHVPYHTSPQTINSIPLQFPAANPITSSFQAPASSLNDLPEVLNLLAHLSKHNRTHQSYHTMPPPIITVPQFPSQTQPNTHESNAFLLNTLLSVLSSRNSPLNSPESAKAATLPQLPSEAPPSTHENNASLLNTLLSVLSSRKSTINSPRRKAASVKKSTKRVKSVIQSEPTPTNQVQNEPPIETPPVQIITTTQKPIEVIASEAPKAPVVNSTCLNCMCKEITDCINTPECTNLYCGIYQISHPYWVDGGRNVLPDDDKGEQQSFLDCVNDKKCADKTVEGYMARYGRDCNRDGVIDCFDFLEIHLGGLHCTHRLTRLQYSEMGECLLKSN